MSDGWDWRIAYNHVIFDVEGKPTFHAYDANNSAACEPMFGLVTSVEAPNEGSNFCRDCVSVVRAQPTGRAPSASTGENQ